MSINALFVFHSRFPGATRNTLSTRTFFTPRRQYAISASFGQPQTFELISLTCQNCNHPHPLNRQRSNGLDARNNRYALNQDTDLSSTVDSREYGMVTSNLVLRTDSGMNHHLINHWSFLSFWSYSRVARRTSSLFPLSVLFVWWSFSIIPLLSVASPSWSVSDHIVNLFLPTVLLVSL